MFWKKYTRKIGILYNSLLPIFGKLAITGCWEISCPCVMSRFHRFCFEGANCASEVRCLCDSSTLTRCVLGPFSWRQVSQNFSILIFHFRTRRIHPQFSFAKEFCRIKNRRLPFKTVSFCICYSCLET